MKKGIWTAVLAMGLLLAGSGAAIAANGVAVNASSALGGTNFGLQVTVTDNLTSTYVASAHPTAESHVLVRFRVDFANMNFPSSGGPNSYFRIMNMIETGDAGQVILFAHRGATGTIFIDGWTKETSGANNFVYAGGFFFSNHAASTANNQIECEWTQATSAVSNDGELRCAKLNTAQQFVRSNLDNFNTVIDEIRVGYFNFDTFNGTGSYKFDEYESYR